MFRNFKDAGEKLALALQQYRDDPAAVVVGIARGGVPVAFEVATHLHLPLEVTCPHKIGAPHNPEYAIGAITETGEGFFNQEVLQEIGVSESFLQHAIDEEKKRAQNRIETYRQGLAPRSFASKTIILIDDGLATGFTMKAAVKSMRESKASKVVVAVPVAPPDTLVEMEGLTDEIICLDAPLFFHAVGQFYEDFTPPEDEEIIELLRLAARRDENHPL